MSTLNVPVGSTDSSRLETELLPVGWQLCTVRGIATIGHVEQVFSGDNKPKKQFRAVMMFEFPLQKAEFFEGQGLEPHNVIHMIWNYSFFKTSNFRKFIESAIGNKMSDAEAATFDIGTMVGTNYVAKIEHDNGYARVNTLEPLNDQMRTLFGLQPGEQVPLIGDSFLYGVGTDKNDYNIGTEEFFKTPEWVTKKIKDTLEGEAYLEKHGSWPVYPESDNGSANGQKRKVIMLVNDFTYEQYIEAEYTDELLVAEGKAKWAEEIKKPETPSTAPSGPSKPSKPSGPDKPSGPASPASPQTPKEPEIPSAPAPVGKRFVFEGDDAYLNEHYQKFVDEGWSPEMLKEKYNGKIVGA